MQKYSTIVLTLVLFLLASTAFAGEDLTPAEIAQSVYDRDVGDDMQMHGKMELISKKGHVRTREFISLRQDRDSERRELIRFTSPADIAGTAFLTIEKNNSSKTEQHLYLPALERTRRIVASQMGRSFVNTDFTYEDMQRHPVDDWTYKVNGEESISGHSCYILVSTPKPETNTQYSKRVSWIEKKHFIPLKTIFRDEKGRKAKIYTVNNFEVIDGIATETDVVMKDLLSGHKTRIETLEIEYNSGLRDSLFTTRALER